VTALELVADGVAVLRLGAAAEHAIGAETVATLRAGVAEASANTAVRAVMICGGERYFSTGASAGMLLAGDPGDSASAVYAWCAEIPQLLLEFAVPTIAVMEGHAVGGGLVIGLWCDAAILAEESMYGANFMALGFTPGMGSTVVLEDTFGGPLARELILTGRMLKGRELRALPCALSHAIVPRADVYPRALELAEQIAQVPRQSLTLLKSTLSRRRRARLDAALLEERSMHMQSFADAETKARLLERFGEPA
jgi:polyketide biosynthesis enoyl-CoA hydratase PksI